MSYGWINQVEEKRTRGQTVLRSSPESQGHGPNQKNDGSTNLPSRGRRAIALLCLLPLSAVTILGVVTILAAGTILGSCARNYYENLKDDAYQR